ncbi:MAG: hypothetical protein ABR541_04905 [Candidatus Dormibacteria bacterium]
MLSQRLTPLAVVVLGLVLAGCGSDPPHIPQALPATPVAASSVSITQTGDPAFAIDPTSVSFGLDDARLLVVRVRVHSSAPKAVTLMMRASIFDAGDHLVGDATGGLDGVGPGTTMPLRLTGPTPIGTIARATFEVTSRAAP